MSPQLTRVVLAPIEFYRLAISPLRPPSCRYLPTCSEYAVDAIRTWGVGRGGWLALRRLLRCHPWHAGGHDPVPPRVASTACAHAAQPSDAAAVEGTSSASTARVAA